MIQALCDNPTLTTSRPGDIVRRYQQTGEVVKWPVPPELQSAVKVTFRNLFAEHLATKDVEEIVRRHVYLSFADMADMVRLATRYVLPKPLCGTGIELGAGCGLLSATVARSDSVQAILAVEVCQRTVELLIPKVAHGVLGPMVSKVVPVAGSFDDLRVPSGAFDFAVEIDSFHHSDNLNLTLAECARVLKPGGMALCFDRCQPDDLTDEDVESMLARVYSRDFLIANAYPRDVRLTRRENGEHEYRAFEWQSAFADAGFTLERKCEFCPWIRARTALKGLLSVLPRSLTKTLYQTSNATPGTTARWLIQQWKSAVARGENRSIFAPTRTTVFLLTKRS